MMSDEPCKRGLGCCGGGGVLGVVVGVLVVVLVVLVVVVLVVVLVVWKVGCRTKGPLVLNVLVTDVATRARLNRMLCTETWLDTELESDCEVLSSSELASELSDWLSSSSSSSSSELPELLVVEILEPQSESLFVLDSVSLLW
ncbi:hypothetical protein CRUP_008725 [Coryphaenoides rupestris]|nr:hypothetical protein CRUP_008725 [Coryphaenoides rupestris]